MTILYTFVCILIFVAASLEAWAFRPRRWNQPSPLNMSFDPPSGYIQAIRSAARMGNVEKLEELTKACSRGHPVLNDKVGDMMGLTPLHWAVASGQAKGRIACVELLVNAGVDIEAINNSGYTPLHYACATGKNECARLLLDRGANIEAKVSSTCYTPLHCAVLKGDEDCALMLIERGAVVNSEDINGDTPLHLARRFGKVECEELLLDNGADTNVKNLNGERPLERESLPLVNSSYE